MAYIHTPCSQLYNFFASQPNSKCCGPIFTSWSYESRIEAIKMNSRSFVDFLILLSSWWCKGNLPSKSQLRDRVLQVVTFLNPCSIA